MPTMFNVITLETNFFSNWFKYENCIQNYGFNNEYFFSEIKAYVGKTFAGKWKTRYIFMIILNGGTKRVPKSKH